MYKDFNAEQNDGVYVEPFDHHANGANRYFHLPPSTYSDDHPYIEKEFCVNQKVEVNLEQNDKFDNWVGSLYKGLDFRSHFVEISESFDIKVISSDKYIRHTKRNKKRLEMINKK